MAKKLQFILVVEDDLALSDAFNMILTHSGFKVHNSHNGKEALDYLSKHTPDIILLDILMPIMDGREFLKHFDNKKHIPIVVLSNLDSKTDIEQLINLGATTYMLKSSVSPDVLVKLVKDTMATT